MFGLPALDIFIGVSFVFLILSLIATGVQEVIQAILGLRGKNLRKGIEQLLDDPLIKDLAEKVYEHPLVSARSHRASGLSGTQGARGPSYLKPATFALALVDVLRELPEPAKAVEAAKNQLATKAAEAGNALATAQAQVAASVADPARAVDAARSLEAAKSLEAEVAKAGTIWGSVDAIVNALPNGPVRQQLLLILANALPGQAKEAIETWFETTMDRVEGWFKRWTLAISVVIGILIAVGGNVDAIGLVRHLADSPEARAALVQQAQQSMASIQKTIEAMNCAPDAPPDDPCKTGKVTLDTAQKNLHASVAMASSAISTGTLPIGWQDDPTPVSWPSRIIGWLLTAIAISVGAPFWFSMLQKLMSFRASGTNPKEQEKEQQEQAQQAAKT